MKGWGVSSGAVVMLLAVLGVGRVVVWVFGRVRSGFAWGGRVVVRAGRGFASVFPAIGLLGWAGSAAEASLRAGWCA